MDELDEYLLFGCLTNHRATPEEVEEARQYWAIHGEAITAEHAERWPGTRPDEYWRWSSPHPRPDFADQPAFLARHGLLTDAERIALDMRPGTDGRQGQGVGLAIADG